MCITMHSSENVKFSNSADFLKMCLGLPQSARLKMLTHKLHFTWICIFINYLHTKPYISNSTCPALSPSNRNKNFPFLPQCRTFYKKNARTANVYFSEHPFTLFYLNKPYYSKRHFHHTNSCAPHVLITPTFERLI